MPLFHLLAQVPDGIDGLDGGVEEFARADVRLGLLEHAGGDHQVVKISDYAVMAGRGILSTPALVIDGQLKFQGKVASASEILALLQA